MRKIDIHFTAELIYASGKIGRDIVMAEFKRLDLPFFVDVNHVSWGVKTEDGWADLTEEPVMGPSISYPKGVSGDAEFRAVVYIPETKDDRKLLHTMRVNAGMPY